MFRVLSYPLSAEAPVWPGNPPAARTEVFESIKQGNAANTTVLHLFSHSGTHLDAPRHFNDQGHAAVELEIDSFIFHSPRVLHVPKPNGGFITVAELDQHSQHLEHADLALLHTEWSSVRDVDPQRYAAKGPLLHPDAAAWLMQSYPSLKAIGIDAVSIGAPDFPHESVKTHQILTGVGRDDGRFVLIFEDLRIDADLGSARRIYAWPLFIEGSDGSPCTIVAEFAS